MILWVLDHNAHGLFVVGVGKNANQFLASNYFGGSDTIREPDKPRLAGNASECRLIGDRTLAMVSAES
jgi:hypothetical protein